MVLLEALGPLSGRLTELVEEAAAAGHSDTGSASAGLVDSSLDRTAVVFAAEQSSCCSCLRRYSAALVGDEPLPGHACPMRSGAFVCAIADGCDSATLSARQTRRALVIGESARAVVIEERVL